MDEREKFKKKYEEAMAKRPEYEEIRRSAYRGSDRRLTGEYRTQDIPPPTLQERVKTYVLVLLFGLFFIGVAGFLGWVGAAIALQYCGRPSDTAWLLACLCVVLSAVSMDAVVYYGKKSTK